MDHYCLVLNFASNNKVQHAALLSPNYFERTVENNLYLYSFIIVSSVADPYHFDQIRIRIQEVKKFVTDPDPG